MHSVAWVHQEDLDVRLALLTFEHLEMSFVDLKKCPIEITNFQRNRIPFRPPSICGGIPGPPWTIKKNEEETYIGEFSFDCLLDSQIEKAYEQVNVVEHWDNEDIDSSFVVLVASDEKNKQHSSDLMENCRLSYGKEWSIRIMHSFVDIHLHRWWTIWIRIRLNIFIFLRQNLSIPYLWRHAIRIDKSLKISVHCKSLNNHQFVSYVIMKCFCFFWMWMLISSFRCRTIQIPEDTRKFTQIFPKQIQCLSAHHHQLSKNPGGSPNDILFGSHFI